MSINPDGLGLFGCKITWTDSIDLNIVGRPLYTHILCQHLKTSFGCCIGSYSISSQFTHHGTYVNDFTRFSLHHALNDSFGNNKRTDQIYFDDLFKIGDFHFCQRSTLDDSSIIDQDVYGTYFFFDFCNGFYHSSFIGNVKTVAESLYSLRLELGNCFVYFFL